MANIVLETFGPRSAVKDLVHIGAYRVKLDLAPEPVSGSYFGTVCLVNATGELLLGGVAGGTLVPGLLIAGTSTLVFTWTHLIFTIPGLHYLQFSLWKEGAPGERPIWQGMMLSDPIRVSRRLPPRRQGEPASA